MKLDENLIFRKTGTENSEIEIEQNKYVLFKRNHNRNIDQIVFKNISQLLNFQSEIPVFSSLWRWGFTLLKLSEF